MQLSFEFNHSVKTFNGEHLNRVQVDAAGTIKKIYFLLRHDSEHVKWCLNYMQWETEFKFKVLILKNHSKDLG